MIKNALLLMVLSIPVIVSARDVIIGYQTINQPRQQCWNEQVASRQQPNYGGVILGGIAGGILGNQVGGGHGREAATAIGAVTGAVVGDNLSDHQRSYQVVQRCRTVYDLIEVPVYGHEDNHWHHHHRGYDRD